MGDAMVPGTMTQSTHRPRVEVQALLRAVAGREGGDSVAWALGQREWKAGGPGYALGQGRAAC